VVHMHHIVIRYRSTCACLNPKDWMIHERLNFSVKGLPFQTRARVALIPCHFDRGENQRLQVVNGSHEKIQLGQ
jgi:hypothetical protein